MSSELAIDPKMIVTTDALPGYEVVKALGTAEGVAVVFFPGISVEAQQARFKEILRDAYLDMIATAARQGAQAIVGLRYGFQGDNIVMVYGTAVTVRRAG